MKSKNNTGKGPAGADDSMQGTVITADSRTARTLILSGFISGIIGLLLTGVIVLFPVLHGQEDQVEHYFIRILLSLSAGAFSLCLTGYLKLKQRLPGGATLEAGGAIAVGVLVFFYFPSGDPPPRGSPYKVISFEDSIDLRDWREYQQSELQDVPVYRTIKVKVVRLVKSDLVGDYSEIYGTTNVNIGLKFQPITNNTSFSETKTDEIGRRNFVMTIPTSQFATNKDTVTAIYRITYWNCHKLDSPSYQKNDITKRFPYPTDNYTISIRLPPRHYTWGSMTLSVTSTFGKRSSLDLPMDRSAPVFTYTSSGVSAGDHYIFFFNDFRTDLTNPVTP
jgi:hypothetical protein